MLDDALTSSMVTCMRGSFEKALRAELRRESVLAKSDSVWREEGGGELRAQQLLSSELESVTKFPTRRRTCTGTVVCGTTVDVDVSTSLELAERVSCDADDDSGFGPSRSISSRRSASPGNAVPCISRRRRRRCVDVAISCALCVSLSSVSSSARSCELPSVRDSLNDASLRARLDDVTFAPDAAGACGPEMVRAA